MFRLMAVDSASQGPEASSSLMNARMIWALKLFPGQEWESGSETSSFTRAKSAHPIERLSFKTLRPGRPGWNSRGLGKTAASRSACATFGI